MFSDGDDEISLSNHAKHLTSFNYPDIRSTETQKLATKRFPSATIAAPVNDEAIRRETTSGNEPCYVCYISMIDKVKTDVLYWILVMPPAWQFAGQAKLGPSWRNCHAVSALILCESQRWGNLFIIS